MYKMILWLYLVSLFHLERYAEVYIKVKCPNVYFLFAWGYFCFCFFETGSCCVAQAGLLLLILQTQPLECWNYSHALIYFFKI
jgi:hypothetical protein